MLGPESGAAGGMQASDAELADRARAGDRDAFARLIERHYDRMHRVAWRMTGSRADAEDVVQEVCCALVEGIAGFRGDASVATWMTGCVVNACRDHGRRSSSLARLRAGLVQIAGFDRAPDARDQHRLAWLASGISRLPADLRSTVVLVAGEGMTHAEAAKALDVAESTVSWRMHEARKRLRFDRLEEALDVR